MLYQLAYNVVAPGDDIDRPGAVTHYAANIVEAPDHAGDGTLPHGLLRAAIAQVNNEGWAKDSDVVIEVSEYRARRIGYATWGGRAGNCTARTTHLLQYRIDAEDTSDDESVRTVAIG